MQRSSLGLDTVQKSRPLPFFSFNFNQKTLDWNENPAKVIPNMYTVSALGWKPDGSRLSVGSLCGAVDLYDACIRRVRYKGRFEFIFGLTPESLFGPQERLERISLSTESLMMEAMRRVDEWQRDDGHGAHARPEALQQHGRALRYASKASAALHASSFRFISSIAAPSTAACS